MGIINFIDKISVQDAIYWGNPQPDGYGGKTFADPVEIKVRWANKISLITGNNGKQETANVEVITNEDLDTGGYLKLGTLSDLNSSGVDPLEVDGAYEIVLKEKVPLIKSSTEFVRTYRLSQK